MKHGYKHQDKMDEVCQDKRFSKAVTFFRSLSFDSNTRLITFKCFASLIIFFSLYLTSARSARYFNCVCLWSPCTFIKASRISSTDLIVSTSSSYTSNPIGIPKILELDRDDLPLRGPARISETSDRDRSIKAALVFTFANESLVPNDVVEASSIVMIERVDIVLLSISFHKSNTLIHVINLDSPPPSHTERVNQNIGPP
mmetsp:Transcript_28513/g.51976  ORF Transcript_28513/g.51976 Transcript_28513/m.51976 type:complete len:200 (-) Transcript_28513:332-931(-)